MLLIIIFHIGLLTSLYYLVVLEHPQQYVQNFFHFTHLKPTFFILHTYFYKTPISVCLLYTFIQIKYSFLYPYSHWPTPTIHTGITQESTQPTGRKPEKQTQQNGSKPTYQDWRLALSNKIDASGGDGENEKQDRRLQRQAVVIARDIQPHSTRNPLIKPIQPENNEKQRKKERSVAMAIGGGGDRRKLEKERLMRGRKID